MIVRVIGGHGGVSPGFDATSYLIDGKLLIDAGSCATGLLIAEQIQIENILISHPHLDHIKDLAFICDNCFGMKESPFQVYTNETIRKAIKDHLLNETIWPDFTKMPNKENPTLEFNILQIEQPFKLGKYQITAIPVNHPGDAMGFIIEKGKTAILFTQDTGPTQKIWDFGHKTKKLKAIFTEVSFPNELLQVAVDSQHHTPNTIKKEIEKMPPKVPIFLGHLKPSYQKMLFKQIEDIGNDRITVLGSDNASYVF